MFTKCCPGLRSKQISPKNSKQVTPTRDGIQLPASGNKDANPVKLCEISCPVFTLNQFTEIQEFSSYPAFASRLNALETFTDHQL
jgi:hypothetical protein